jgi:hypothetical protein
VGKRERRERGWERKGGKLEGGGLGGQWERWEIKEDGGGREEDGRRGPGGRDCLREEVVRRERRDRLRGERDRERDREE